MIYVCFVFLVLLNIAGFCFFYKAICAKLDAIQQKAYAIRNTAAEKIDTPKVEETPDTKATNAERLYMEGIQAVLGYDKNVMMQYLKGVEDE